jgi:pimeloyl-ACP methyl ester carboxylesterase
MNRYTVTLPEGTISVCQWGAQKPSGKPVLHWAHANGFNGQTYDPLLAPLAERFDIHGWDARGHGLSTLPANPKHMTSWYIYRDDLEKLVSHLADAAGQKIWLGGHSMGGCASMLLAAKRPDLVAGLVLADPVIMAGLFSILSPYLMALRGRGHALMELAKKRRAVWPDAETLLAAYTGRGAFASWQDGFLAAYLAGGLKPRPDDSENTVELACDPQWEAANFKGPQLMPERWIKKLRVPFTLLMAEKGSTTRSVAPFHVPRVDKKIDIVAGSTHFIPMEFPELVRDEIIARLEG